MSMKEWRKILILNDLSNKETLCLHIKDFRSCVNFTDKIVVLLFYKINNKHVDILSFYYAESF